MAVTDWLHESSKWEGGGLNMPPMEHLPHTCQGAQGEG